MMEWGGKLEVHGGATKGGVTTERSGGGGKAARR